MVRFLSDGFTFNGTPQFPEVRIDGAIVVPPRSGRNWTERRNGQTWMGVERRYQVYPRRAGADIVTRAMEIIMTSLNWWTLSLGGEAKLKHEERSQKYLKLLHGSPSYV